MSFWGSGLRLSRSFLATMRTIEDDRCAVFCEVIEERKSAQMRSVKG
jgi:hypothetical protein